MTFLDKGLTQADVDIGILILNLAGELVEVSAQYLVMTGFQKEELLGKRIDDIDNCSAEKVLSNKSDFFGHYHSILTRKDGSNFPIKVCYFRQQTQASAQILLFIQECNYVELAKTPLLSKFSIIPMKRLS